MNVERETVLILVLVAAVLAPLWFLALQTTEAQPEVELADGQVRIEPTGQFVSLPSAVSEFVAGVLTWVGLAVLVGLLYVTQHLVRREAGTGSPATNGGTTVSLPSYLASGDRRLVEYWPAGYSTPGLAWLAVTTVATVAFSVLFALEAMGLARTQFLGVYGGMLFLSLGALVVAYTVWFLPTMHLAEDRHHPERAGSEGREGEE